MIAWMFPGQGAQSPGMGRDLLQQFPIAREILAEAEDLSGLSLNELRERGPLEAMTRVQCLEPLLTAISIGYAQTLIDSGLTPDFVAGYSAGEVPALYVAGVLSRTDALRAATIRGQVLSQYIDDQVRMVAISRVPKDKVKAIIESLGSDTSPSNGEFVQAAGWNAPDHVTIVGTDSVVRQAESRLVAQGAEASEVFVSGMWHSSQLAPAAKVLREELRRLSFASPRIPILTSATGRITATPDHLRCDLADQVALPVQWHHTIEQLRNEHVNDFVEVGTGRTLMGMLRRIWPDATQYTVTSVEGRAGNIKPLKRILSSLAS